MAKGGWHEIRKWKRSVMYATAHSPKMRHAIHIQPETNDQTGIAALKQALDGGLLEDAIDSFMKEEFIPALWKEYQKFIGGGDHDPYKIDLEENISLQTDPLTELPFGDMDRGLRDLFPRITTYKVESSGGRITASLGPHDKVTELRLSDYTAIRGRTTPAKGEPNTLFYAVEFGTGMAKNVGGAEYVRTDSRFKTSDPSYRGAWWYRRNILVTGQKGIHFLYEERTRKPKTHWNNEVRTRLPAHLTKFIKARGFTKSKFI